MLEDDGVAEHEVRCGEASDLVVGEVPGHDAQQRTDRATLDEGLAARHRFDRLIGGELRSVVGVVVEDLLAEFGLFLSFRGGLAHLLSDDLRELFFVLAEESGDLVDDRCAFLDRLLAPAQVALVCGFEDLLDLFVGGIVELLDDFTGGRVLDTVAACRTAYVAHSRLL